MDKVRELLRGRAGPIAAGVIALAAWLGLLYFMVGDVL